MKEQKETITIDARGKRLGRLATEIANILNGKNTPDYAPNRVPEVVVEVANAAQLQITEKKKAEKVYERYSGYFGGRKETTLAQMAEKKGYSEVLRKAVFGMLPNNRLRKEKIKQLHINE